MLSLKAKYAVVLEQPTLPRIGGKVMHTSSSFTIQSTLFGFIQWPILLADISPSYWDTGGLYVHSLLVRKCQVVIFLWMWSF